MGGAGEWTKHGVSRRQALGTAMAGGALLTSGAARASDAGAEPIVTHWREDDVVTVRAGTNFAVAPSPDATMLAIDLGGVIGLLPAGGGRARPLTDPMLDASQPDWMPDGSGIVFQAYGDGNFQLWRVAPEGGVPRQLTFGTDDCREPAVSPDGKSIAFVGDRGGRCRVHVLDLATGEIRLWNDLPGEAAQPAWSPDGKQIVCILDGRRVVAATMDGALREIASVPRAASPLDRSLVAGPAFVPGSDRVAYVRIEGADARLCQSEGADLVKDEDIFPFRPRWLVDGSIAYSADGAIRVRRSGAARAEEIAIEVALPVARNSPRRAGPASPSRRSQPVRGIGSPVLSPDGSRLAFRALNALWVMPRGGRPQRVVGDGYCIVDPTWSPDGRHLAFVSDRGGTLDIWLRDMESGALRQLTRLDGAAAAPAWSPDGAAIAFLDHQGALFICTVAEGAVRQLHAPLFVPGKPCWSADGKTLALAALVPASARFREGTNQILFVDVATGQSRYQPLPERASIAVRGDDGPVWSPDGRHLAFVVASRLWVWRVAPDGTPIGEPRRINDEVTDCPRWAGGSDRLSYLASGKLRLIGLDGGRPATLPVPLSWASPRRARPLLVRAGRLWDGRTRVLQGPTDIVMQDGVILSVKAAAVEKPGDAVEFVDASALTAMPGLVDAHMHVQMAGHGLGDREGRLWLALGVTAVRSLAGAAYQGIEYREAVASGHRVGPRLFTTGEAIDGSRIFYHMMRPLTESGQLDREMERARALSYDVMKCYVRLPAAAQREVVRRAHRLGIPATGHYLYPGAAFGMDGLEHMGATNKLGYARTVSFTGRVYGDVEAVLAHSGAAHVPTLFQASLLYRDDPALLDDPRIRALMTPWDYRRLTAIARSPDSAAARGQLKILEHNVAHLIRLTEGGGLVVAGTDAPLDLVATSLHMNLRAMVRYGMSPVDALFTATRNAGRMLGERVGEVTPGAHADLAIVAGNPLDRIEDAARTRMVVASGVCHDIAALIAPFARGTQAPVPLAQAPMPSSPYWWHDRAFVDGCRGGCCGRHA